MRSSPVKASTRSSRTAATLLVFARQTEGGYESDCREDGEEMATAVMGEWLSEETKDMRR
jgi:hypothetical protein